MMTAVEEIPKNGLVKFISGVVEGFYGRPWSADQRKLLFGWMQKSGLNTYMYAPKDDYKHRAYWRDLYSVEEAENLTHLISSAKEKNITFVYAVSPGLDISFSNSKDVQALKRKLEQVATFGCEAFAVLFDDIDPELSETDRSAFQSFGLAQVSISNEVFEYLGQPKLFLFCPTEYCSSRATPNVSSSEYLNTIGSKLLPGIDIMWTGPRVVSKKLTIQALEEIASVLKRPAVIWDNIHANDYDPRRVFLGPYEGRSPEIIPYINGVMTNPNTEFEANFMAIHTLGQWCCSNPDGVKKDIVTTERDRLSPIAADIKLETESDFSSDEDLPCRIDFRYQPKSALRAAVTHWLAEIHSIREPPRQPFPRVIPTLLPTVVPSGPPGVLPIPPPVPGPPVILTPSPTVGTPPGVPSCPPGNPSIPPGITPFPPSGLPSPLDIPSAAPPCMDPTDLESPEILAGVPYMPASPPAGLPLPDVIKTCLTPASTSTTITTSGIIMPLPILDANHNLPQPPPTFLQPPSLPVNSLSDMPQSDIDLLSDGATSGAEPMDVAMPCSSSDLAEIVTSSPSSVSMPPSDHENGCLGGLLSLEKQNSSDSLMQVESAEMMVDKKLEEGMSDKISYLTEDDALLLVDLFYMPFEHGAQGLFLLQRLHWLRNNCQCIAKKDGKHNSFEATEWHHLAEEYSEKVDIVIRLLDKVVSGPNKSFMCDVYSYLWDLVSILKICKAYVQWLALGLATHPLAQQTYNCVTWFTKTYRDAFMNGEQEPWIFRGGLQSELQRLLPVDSAHDLFYIKPPDYIVTKSFNIRPYKPMDEDAVYLICLKTCDDGMDGTDVFPDNPQLMGDKLLGRLITLSSEYGFVIEDEVGVCGYVLASLDAKDLAKKSQTAWIPAICEKYPVPDCKKDVCSPAEEVIQGFHGEQASISEDIYSMYPSVLRMDILASRVEDPAIPRRLLASVLSALKSSGSKGAHVELSVGDKYMVDFYAKLGFFPITTMEEPAGDLVYLGRPI